MRVGLLIGPCHVGQCGVGDYSACLCDALRANGIDANVVRSGDWRLHRVLATRDLLRSLNFDIVHIQYPTSGFGVYLGPQLLSLLQPCVVTVHEASQRRIPRKLSLLPFAVRPQHVIFTSIVEQQYALKWAPWVSGRSSIIPVASAIPEAAHNVERAIAEIVHFGLIMPNKGLEQVLELAVLIKTSALPLEIHIVGQVPSRHTNYFSDLRAKAHDLPVVWHQGLSRERVAERLARSWIAYLPYPDGASDRRTSLRSTLLNGLAVITTKGTDTPSALDNIVRFCSSPRHALCAIRELVEDRQQLSAMSAKAISYSRQFSWERIAQQHLEIYSSALGLSATTANPHSCH